MIQYFCSTQVLVKPESLVKLSMSRGKLVPRPLKGNMCPSAFSRAGAVHTADELEVQPRSLVMVTPFSNHHNFLPYA